VHSKENKDAEKKPQEKQEEKEESTKGEVENNETEKGLEELKKKLAEKEKESVDYLDKYKRTLAEMENLRKRTVLEKQESLKYSNFNIIGDLVGLLDDFQRAIDSAKKNEQQDLQSFVNGVDMIEKQFIDLLHKKYGVVKYGEAGEEFDPRIHMALTMEKGDYEYEKVIEVFRKGYMLFERVIRPAEVKIGRPKDDIQTASSQEPLENENEEEEKKEDKNENKEE